VKKFKLWVVTTATLLVMFGVVSTDLLPEAQAQYQIFLPIIIKSPYEPEKGGVVINGLGNASSCDDLTLLGEGWYFNNDVWPSTGPGCYSGDRRFVPRLYNGAQVNDPVLLNQAINNAKDSGWLLGFVEPNLPWQGYTTPADGARAWKKLENAITAKGLVLGDDIKLVAPAPNQWNPGDRNANNVYGNQWVWYMVTEYQKQNCPATPPDVPSCKPHFDAMAWNYYRDNYSLSPYSEFTRYFTTRRDEAKARGLPEDMWIMEYSGNCWYLPDVDAHEVMDQVTPWLKSTPWITRYVWFGNRLENYTSENLGVCSLLDKNGNLNSLGTKYRGY
jgi:hypothetical protein